MFTGRAIILFFLCFLTIFASTHSWVPILDEANLIFHEAGHTLMPFGEIINLAAGSFFQILIPFVVAVSFLRKHELFSAVVSFWWMGESMLGVARYVADARAQKLELIGGEHDWAVLLAHWPQMMQYDTMIGAVIRGMGTIIMLTAIYLAFLLIVTKRKTSTQATEV